VQPNSIHSQLDPQLQRQIERAAEALLNADGIVIAAGAGMGVDSGLPDFRGPEGFWNAYPALKKSRTSFEQIANPTFLEQNPVIGWGFYAHRLALYRETKPHPGFAVIKRWDGAAPQGVFVITSNVDGQFQKAGFRERSVWEIHGSIHHLQCTIPFFRNNRRCETEVWSASHFHPEIDEANLWLTSPLPTCAICGAMARPNILMFGDFEWVRRRATSQRLHFEEWIETVERVAVVEIGAGTAIPSIRTIGQELAKRRGTLIRINVREPEVERPQDISIACGARDALLAIDEVIRARLQQPSDSTTPSATQPSRAI
jgi:NAD-dependent SIR2 family protein deacetylase